MPETHPLAVVLPEVGIRTETFIRRHVQDLLPGGCVAVTDEPPNPVVAAQGGPDWVATGPVIDGNPGPRPPLDPPPSPDRIATVAAELRAAGVQVVLGEYLDFSLRWLPLALDHGFRFFVHGHGVDLTRQLATATWRDRYLAYADVAGVIVPTRAAKVDLVDAGLPGDRISVVPYGIDVPDQPPHRAPGPRVRCVAVGRLVPKKSPETILTAFALARRDCPTLRLDYVGDGPLRDEATALAQDLVVDRDVSFLGDLDHRQTLATIRSADIFLHGSETDPTGDGEGLPVAILEAMAAALPVVATDHNGIAEAVVHGHTGYLAPEGHAADLAEHIVRLANNPAQRRELGHAGWRRARELFTWPRNRDTLLGVLGIAARRRV